MDVTSYSIIGVIGLALSIFLWFLKRNDDKKKAKENEDKIIDSANDADSLLSEFDKLRNK